MNLTLNVDILRQLDTNKYTHNQNNQFTLPNSNTFFFVFYFGNKYNYYLCHSLKKHIELIKYFKNEKA